MKPGTIVLVKHKTRTYQEPLLVRMYSTDRCVFMGSHDEEYIENYNIIAYWESIQDLVAMVEAIKLMSY